MTEFFENINTHEYYEEPKIFGNTTYIENIFIKDSDILRYVGIPNYMMLQRKFPNYFSYFEILSFSSYKDIFVPGDINLYINGTPETIKKDIVKTMFYKKNFSSNSYLVSDDIDEPMIFNEKPVEYSIWIFICIIIVVLLIFSTYLLFMFVKTNEKVMKKINYK